MQLKKQNVSGQSEGYFDRRGLCDPGFLGQFRNKSQCPETFGSLLKIVQIHDVYPKQFNDDIIARDWLFQDYT